MATTGRREMLGGRMGHAGQALAESALKALLVRQGQRARTHGLLHLLECLPSYYPEVSRLDRAARGLDRFYIPTRDPDALPAGTSAAYFREQDAGEARAAGDEILSFARQELAPP